MYIYIKCKWLILGYPAGLEGTNMEIQAMEQPSEPTSRSSAFHRSSPTGCDLKQIYEEVLQWVRDDWPCTEWWLLHSFAIDVQWCTYTLLHALRVFLAQHFAIATITKIFVMDWISNAKINGSFHFCGVFHGPGLQFETWWDFTLGKVAQRAKFFSDVLLARRFW